MSKIAYYISAHGYGHGVRSVAICSYFSSEVQLVFRTGLPEAFFKEELSRPFSCTAGSFDCGCLQKDSITVDVRATIDRYREIAGRNDLIVEQEVQWLRDNKFDGVVADMPPFALEAAARAGIRSAIVTNFTWYHVYREYLDAYPTFAPFVERIRHQYSCAGLMLESYPAMDMSLFPRRKSIPVVGRVGINRRDELCARYGIGSGKRIGLIYTGTFGMDSVAWKRLESFSDWEFLGLFPLGGSPRNYRVISKNEFMYQDLSASADAVISKIGYGTFAESVLHGVPLLYVPRTDFAEFPVLESALMAWGHGSRIEESDFNAVNWGPQLNAIAAQQRPLPWENAGARVAAQEIENFFG